MKTVSTIKSSNTDSPKTPGGISKSLLTPCRRVGLSRNFKQSSASPFRSPMSSKIEIKQEKYETIKRKEPTEENSQTPENDSGILEDQNVQTPSRKVEQPRRKKSKTLLTSIIKSSDEKGNGTETFIDNTESEPCETLPIEPDKDLPATDTSLKLTSGVSSKQVVTLCLKSKSGNKKSPSISFSKEATTNSGKENVSNSNAVTETEPKTNKEIEINKKSPNNLTKECIVVIQKKIIKKEIKDKEKLGASSTKTKENIRQVFDSDSDDVPLICLNKDTEKQAEIITMDDSDEDFVISNTKISKPVKSKSKLKSPKPKSNSKIVKVQIHKAQDTQSDDDDDDDFKKKRTILIRKTYDKVMKPHKMKSTGSITQKDIDDLNTRIEIKKKLLLARAGSEDTKQLMDLIKKWRKGCQDSLIELMDLMKTKFSDKNMGYSEILEILKIPSTLVHYDSENDCFLTPDDESVLASLI